MKCFIFAVLLLESESKFIDTEGEKRKVRSKKRGRKEIFLSIED